MDVVKSNIHNNGNFFQTQDGCNIFVTITKNTAHKTILLSNCTTKEQRYLFFLPLSYNHSGIWKSLFLYRCAVYLQLDVLRQRF